VFLILS
jgi:hypothetical protein